MHPTKRTRSEWTELPILLVECGARLESEAAWRASGCRKWPIAGPPIIFPDNIVYTIIIYLIIEVLLRETAQKMSV